MNLVAFGDVYYNMDQLVRIKPGRVTGIGKGAGKKTADILVLCFSDGKTVEVSGDELALVRRMIASMTLTLDRYVDSLPGPR